MVWLPIQRIHVGPGRKALHKFHGIDERAHQYVKRLAVLNLIQMKRHPFGVGLPAKNRLLKSAIKNIGVAERHAAFPHKICGVRHSLPDPPANGRRLRERF